MCYAPGRATSLLTPTSESTGLPASFGDPDESDPEPEVEDEGDEDSNGQFEGSTKHTRIPSAPNKFEQLKTGLQMTTRKKKTPILKKRFQTPVGPLCPRSRPS